MKTGLAAHDKADALHRLMAIRERLHIVQALLAAGNDTWAIVAQLLAAKDAVNAVQGIMLIARLDHLLNDADRLTGTEQRAFLDLFTQFQRLS